MFLKRMTGLGLAAVMISIGFSSAIHAQYRDRNRDSQVAPEDREGQTDRDKQRRGARPGDRRDQQGRPVPRSQAQPRGQRGPAAPGQARPRQAQSREQQRPAQPDRSRGRQAQPQDQRRGAAPDRSRGRQPAPARRAYDRRPERSWNKDRPSTQRRIFIPRRWSHIDRPHHPKLAHRHFGRVWWCGVGCRIGLLFGFTVWAVDTVVSHNSSYSFPIWEALEYNQTGETSLWESDWGYVEFTPTRTFRERFGRHVRDCRDFLRVVVRDDGLERRYEGTACRNLDGAWWIVSSRQVFP